MALYVELGEGQWFTLELDLEWLYVIFVDVSVSHRKHEFLGLAIGDFSDHIGEQSVAGNVEGDSQPEIAGTLVHLTRELLLAPTLCVSVEVGDEELAEHVARRESHESKIFGVPCTEQDPAIGGVVLDLVNDFTQLVNALTGVVGVAVLVFCAKVSPLEAVDWTQITFSPVLQVTRVEELSRSVTVPDVHALVSKKLGVGLASHKPEELLQYASQEDTLCGEQRQIAVGKVEAEARLRCKESESASTCAIGSRLACRNDTRHELEVLRLLVLCRALRIALRPCLRREDASNSRLSKVVMSIAEHNHSSSIHLEQATIGQRQAQPSSNKDPIEVTVADQQDIARLRSQIMPLLALVNVARLKIANFGNDRIDSVTHVLCRLSWKLVRSSRVIWGAPGPNVPARVLGSNLLGFESLVGTIVPLAALLQHLHWRNTLSLVGGNVFEHDLECVLGSLPWADKDVVELGRVNEFAIADTDDARCQLTHHFLAMRCEGDIGSSSMLARDGPFGLAVAGEEDSRRGHVGQLLFPDDDAGRRDAVDADGEEIVKNTFEQADRTVKRQA